MNFKPIAVFLGASPLGTALLLSLLVTLVVLLVIRIALKMRALALPDWVKRLTSMQRHRLFLLGGFLSVALGINIVASLTEGLTEVPQVAEWDQTFVATAHTNLSSGELLFFQLTTDLAGRWASILLGFGVGFILLYQKDKRMLWLWVAGLIGNSVLIQLLKQTYQRPRPELLAPFLTEHNFSFPSGHASASVLMYGLLAYIAAVRVPGLNRRQRFALLTSVVWLGVMIGTSRLALGVHYPTDVLAGWCVALSWLGTLICVDRYGQHRSRTTIPADALN